MGISVGKVIIIVGLLVIIVSTISIIGLLRSDISVPSPLDGDKRVVNLGKMDERNSLLIVSSAFLIAGVLMVGFGILGETISARNINSDNFRCPVCNLELVETFEECKRCNTKLFWDNLKVFTEKDYQSHLDKKQSLEKFEAERLELHNDYQLIRDFISREIRGVDLVTKGQIQRLSQYGLLFIQKVILKKKKNNQAYICGKEMYFNNVGDLELIQVVRNTEIEIESPTQNFIKKIILKNKIKNAYFELGKSGLSADRKYLILEKTFIDGKKILADIVANNAAIDFAKVNLWPKSQVEKRQLILGFVLIIIMILIVFVYIIPSLSGANLK